jgi:hypothetical protein
MQAGRLERSLSSAGRITEPVSEEVQDVSCRESEGNWDQGG